MAGYNVFLCDPEDIPGPPRRLKAKVYLRERPDDDNPGTERDLGKDPIEIDVIPMGFNATDITLQNAIDNAIATRHDGLVISSADRDKGLRNLFISEAWRRLGNET